MPQSVKPLRPHRSMFDLLNMRLLTALWALVRPAAISASRRPTDTASLARALQATSRALRAERARNADMRRRLALTTRRMIIYRENGAFPDSCAAADRPTAVGGHSPKMVRFCVPARAG